jgi:YVTN family beta-propeller protein
VLATVPARLAAGSLAPDPAADRVYCVNFGDASITVIDGKTDQAIGQIQVDYAPCKIVIDSPRARAYVANSLVSTVSVVDLNKQKVVATIPVERAPVGMASGKGGSHIYAANRGAGSVSVIDRASGKEWARVPVGEAPGDLASDEQSSTLFVSNAGSNSVSVFRDQLEGKPKELPRTAKHPLVGQPVPPFQLPDMNTGQVRSSAEWQGKPYIINMFASW